MGIIDKQKGLRKLPKLRGGVQSKTLKIEDCEVVVRKAKSRNSVPVAARFIALIGRDLFALLVHDDDQDPDGVTLSKLLSLDISDEADLNSLLLTIVIPMIQKKLEDPDVDIHYFFEQLLPNNVDVDGITLGSMDDFDECEFGFMDILKVFWVAVKVNFFPTLAAPSTNDGGQQGAESAEENPVIPSESSSEETISRTGQSGQIHTS